MMYAITIWRTMCLYLNILHYIIVIIIIVHTVNDNAISATNDVNINTLIYKYMKGATILQTNDISRSDCGETKNPGLVTADFDADGYKDYAVIFNTHKKAKKAVLWEGKKLNLYRFKFVVFLSYYDKIHNVLEYKSYFIEDIEEYLPATAIVMLELQKPGKIKEYDSGKYIEIKNYGITRIYCGKSSSVFYYNKNKFNEIAISD